MKSFDETNIGKRTSNQDKVAIVNTHDCQLLALVCDGMGGHNSGELASKIVCEYVVECFKRMPVFISAEEAQKWLKEAIIGANGITKKQAQTSTLHAGMGTTIVVALLYKNKVYVANVGDSRCYYVNDTITQWTNDDTFVNELIKSGVISKEEAKFHPKRNVLMKAMGIEDMLDIQIQEYEMLPGYLLLCSDGLYNAVNDEQIKEIVTDSSSVADKCHRLIELALKQNGSDNISVALIEVEGVDLNVK